MSYNFFAMLSRMKNIYRWGLMRNVKSESLSEHTLETAYIAHALAIIENTRLGGNIDESKVALAALFHDSSEIITGDLPTPVKYFNADIKTAYKEIEKNAENTLLNMLPDDLRPSYAEHFSPDAETRRFVKAADKISAFIKCIEEKNMGNKEFLQAEKSTLKSIKELKLPAADIFLDEFIKSYSLTLDELKP